MALIRRLTLVALCVAVVSMVGCSGTSKREQSDSLLMLGMSHLMANNNQKAFVSFHEALALDADNKEVHMALGTVHLRLEEYGRAEEYFQSAARIDPEYSEAYNNICMSKSMRKQYQEAIEYCNKALANPLYPTPEKAYYNLGRIYMTLGKYQDAVNAFNNSIKRAPNFIRGYYELALAYNAMKDYGRAAEMMGVAIGLDPNFKGDRLKAEARFRELRPTARHPEEFNQMIEILHY